MWEKSFFKYVFIWVNYVVKNDIFRFKNLNILYNFLKIKNKCGKIVVKYNDKLNLKWKTYKFLDKIRNINS